MNAPPAGLVGEHALDRSPVWAKLALGAVLGGLAGFSVGPTQAIWLLVIAFILVFRMHAFTTGRNAALLGWVFGTAYFMTALRWITEPFQIDPDAHAWMAPFAWVFLGAGLALFWMVAFWSAARVKPTLRPLTLAFTLTLAELIRAYIFTGFPWANPAQAFVGTGADGLLSYIGPYGLILALMLSCAAMAWVMTHRLPVFAVGLVPMILLLASGALWKSTLPETALTGHTVRLIQPNVPQTEKWDPAKANEAFFRQIGFISEPSTTGKAPDLIVMPETALPWLLDHAEEPLAILKDAAQGTPVVLGIQRRPEVRIYNSAILLDGAGAIADIYDKHHLVPFGEYIPFGDLLGQFGIQGLAQTQGSGFSAGPGPQLMDLGKLGKALPLICYEAVFPQDTRGTDTRPDFLMQLTNDAWFGDYAGPQQHLAQAQMRSIEQGLPMVRAANTGVSAMIDPYGRILQSIPLNQAGWIDAVLPAPLKPTLYSRSGDLPLAALLVLCTAGLMLWARPRGLTK